MGYTNKIVRDGQTITLTEVEIESIYRYQQNRYQILDARHHVNSRILQYTDRDDNCWDLDLSAISDNDLLPESSSDDIEEFHKLLNFTDDDLKTLTENFNENLDCNSDENTIWDNVITEYLKTAT